MRKPDFFIVGAPKCGTTAMDHYLKQHPEIFLPDRKEPQFFGSDIYSPAFIRDEAEYLRLFSEVGGERRVGETSVWSLYSRVAAREIARFSPHANVIIMLRNPTEMLYSMHSQYLYTGNEDIESFAEALDAEEDRKNGRRIPETVTFVEGLFYRDSARYHEQVQRYIETFGREKVHVILFDDLKADPANVYAETLRFLDVDPSFLPDLKVVNPNKRVRSKALRDASKYSQGHARRLARSLVPSRLRRGLMSVLDRYNTVYEPPRPIERETSARLRAEFAPEVERLGELLGRDLSAWNALPERGS